MHTFIEPLILGLALSVDSFSAALALGFRQHKTKDVCIFATLSGGTEALVTWLGALAGYEVVSRYSTFSHWLAITLLIAVALHMVYEGITEFHKPAVPHESFHSLLKIIVVSFATSLDGLAVGVSLGIAHKPLIIYLISIGTWAALSTIGGMALAKRAPKHIASYFNFIAAIVLILIALNVI